MTDTLYYLVKVLSRVKNHLFSKYPIFRWLSRAHQDLSFKKRFLEKMFFLCRLKERKSFFYANYLNWSLTSPVTLDTHAAVIVLTVFPWISEMNASKEEKRACPFSSSTARRKKTTKSFCKVWASKLAERQGLLLQSRKMAKRWCWRIFFAIILDTIVKDC